MNEQQLQQILTIQQAIAAAATAAVINSLLNPQQQQQQQAINGGASSPSGQIDTNNRTAQDLLAHLQQQAAVANLVQHQNDVDQQDPRPNSRLGSPIGTSSPASNQQIDTTNQTIQNLLMQLQQQATAGANPLSAISNASAMAALNLNLNNQLPSQMPNITNNGSPIGRSSLGQNDSFHHSASPTTSNTQQSNQMPNNKKLKRYHQPQSNQLNRSSLDATSKPHSSPKSHSAISNLAPSRNNSSSTTNSSTSSSSAFLPNNVGLPRKLVRGQDVWLGRGAEQTRQILKCMWCGQSFRTLAEMTQHMKVTQHYTNIISQEQITSWKQPESSDSNLSKQSARHSNHSKTLDEAQDTSSEKFNDSDRDDSLSNDDEPPQPTKVAKPRSTSASKASNSSPKNKRDLGVESREAMELSLKEKYTSRSSKRENEDGNQVTSLHEDSDAENSSASAASSQKRTLNNTGDALKGNDEDNKLEDTASPDERIKTESGDERTNDSIHSDNDFLSPEQGVNLKSNGTPTKSPESCRVGDKNSDTEEEQADKTGQDEQRDSIAVNDEEDKPKDSDNDCDKRPRKRSKEKSIELDAIKRISAEGQKGDGSGDPLSALETMVEKSFDPRMRPGLASGGILQRLGIDEEVCPPWQHINYANWYAAAAYGHPMAAALLAAGMNLQNGIKLSKNMNQKKDDE